MKPLKSYFLLMLILSFNSETWAGGESCDSLTTGNWSASSTWTGCSGTIPQNSDSVTIKSGHIVTLDVNSNEILSMSIEVGGDFDVALDGAGLTLFGSVSGVETIDLSNASIDLFGDFTIDAQGKNVLMGSIDGAFDLTINSTGETRFNGIIGGSTALISLITDSGGTTVFANTNGGINTPNVKINNLMQLSDPVFLAEHTNFNGNTGTTVFNNTLDSESTSTGITFGGASNSIITFNGDIGAIIALDAIRLSNSNNSTVEFNLSQVNTTGLQKWNANILLNSLSNDVSFTSSNAESIEVGGSSDYLRSQNDGEDSLSINTSGAVTIKAIIGDNSQRLSDFTINSGSTVTIKSSGITVTGTQVFTGPVILTENIILSADVIDIQSTVDNGGFDLSFNTTDVSATSGIDGVLSGTGDLIKQGVGDFTLEVDNSFTGKTQIEEGTLILLDTTNNNPIASSSEIALSSDAILDPKNISALQIPSGQTLSGVGSITSEINALSGSNVSPGYDGVLDVIGVISTLDFVIVSGSQLNINITGSNNSYQYGRLSVTGSVDVDGATLNLEVFNITVGDKIVIVENDGIDSITGTFDALPEVGSLIVDSQIFSISYQGGDGNDIELTKVPCQSIQDGLWSFATTWVSCDGTVPQSTDDVNVLHAVSLDVDATIQSLVFGTSGDFDVAASGGGLTLEITEADVDFSLIDIELFGDFTITNTNNKITFGAIDGDFNLVINSNNTTNFIGDHSGVNGLKSIVTDAGGTTRINQNRTFQLNGNVDSVFNDNITIGPSSVTTSINQVGSGNLIFNGNITSYSGGPHNLTINNDTGQSMINGTVSLGSFTTNGTANTVISGGSISVKKGGSDSGIMTFNGPIVVTDDTVFTLTSSSSFGEIVFNNTLNDDGNLATDSAVTINNPNETQLSAIGSINPLDSLTTDTLGTTTLSGDIDTLISTTFNDAVVLANNIELSGVIDDMKSDVNNAGFNLTFDTSNNTGDTGIDGVLSGSGNFIKEGLGDMSFYSINTMTGNLIVNSGNVINKNAANSSFPGVVEFSLADNTQAYLGGGGTSLDTFELIDGQVIKGEGVCQCILDVKSGAIIAPGFSPGNLSLGGFKMTTGATLAIELDGTNSSNEYDWISSSVMANLDGDSSGGATLDITLGFTPQIGDEFTILQFGAPFAISGTFNGLAEGATFSTNNTLFSITYTGGGNDNNDVVLTALGSSIIYVDKTAAAMGDGAAWNTAFNNLQDALVVAVSGSEIWVAAGTYYPDEGTGQFNNDPASTFDLINGINLYGGFNGTESELSERNPAMNVTILSGDVDVDDVNLDNNNIAESVTDIRGSNSYHVINGESVDNSTIFDGFTVTSGNANGGKGDAKGGGMTCEDFGPSINQVMFIGNYALQSSGATFGCTQNVSNTVYMNNHSDAISGAVETNNGGNFNNVIFEGNVASTAAGALHNTINTLTIYNSSFINNHAINGVGGAISSSANTIMETVLFLGNKADENIMKMGNVADGGSLYISNSSNATLTNITMTGNNSAGIGGAFRFDSSGILGISNSIIWNNQDSTGQGTLSASISSLIGGTTTISNSLIQGSGGSLNWDMTAGIDGGNNLDEEPLFVTDTDPSTAPTSVGDARLQSLSMAIDTGENSVVTSLTDLNNRDRIVNTTVDMGAYEFFEEQVFADGFE